MLEFLLRLIFGGVRLQVEALLLHSSTIAMMHGPINIMFVQHRAPMSYVIRMTSAVSEIKQST